MASKILYWPKRALGFTLMLIGLIMGFVLICAATVTVTIMDWAQKLLGKDYPF